jgi:hypothetical protein
MAVQAGAPLARPGGHRDENHHRRSDPSACTHLAALAILARIEGGCGKKTGGARNLQML